MSQKVRHEVSPRYVVTLQPGPHIDAIKSLRAALKVLGRRFGLRCLKVDVYPAAHAVA
jgi:hypothetical protein